MPVGLGPRGGRSQMRYLQLELGVLAVLLASFLTIPRQVPHIVAGVAWTLLTGAHVARRRRVYAAIVRSRRRRALATSVLLACTGLVTVSGVLQWADMTAAMPWHGGSSTCSSWSP
jgi:hypothetical protein